MSHEDLVLHENLAPGAPNDFFFRIISVRRSRYCLDLLIPIRGRRFLDDRSIHVQVSKLI